MSSLISLLSNLINLEAKHQPWVLTLRNTRSTISEHVLRNELKSEGIKTVILRKSKEEMAKDGRSKT